MNYKGATCRNAKCITKAPLVETQNFVSSQIIAQSLAEAGHVDFNEFNVSSMSSM